MQLEADAHDSWLSAVIFNHYFTNFIQTMKFIEREIGYTNWEKLIVH
jgi:hypothetical protein